MLGYFKNKVVTLFTVQTNRHFPSDQIGFYQFSQYFTGRVEEADHNGIWLVHDQTKTKSFFNWQWVVGICEEQVVDENHPVVKKALEKKPFKEMSITELGNMVKKS